MKQKWIRGRGSNFGALGETLREIRRPRVQLVVTPRATKTFFQAAAFHVVAWLVPCSPMPIQPERDETVVILKKFPRPFCLKILCKLRKWTLQEAKAWDWSVRSLKVAKLLFQHKFRLQLNIPYWNYQREICQRESGNVKCLLEAPDRYTQRAFDYCIKEAIKNGNLSLVR